ncbi:histamine H4 receptor [Ctenodactylus gundi]
MSSPGDTQIILTFLMTLLAFAIMFGNAVVILAFVVDKNLRHRSNYFFLNLAISDFFVGAISIPLYSFYTWPGQTFGKDVCVFWLVTDYLLCTASVYNIVLISYDRYQSVSNAVSYRAQHSGILKIVTQMVAVWVLSFLTNGPMILISESWKNNTSECEPGFFSKWYVLAITSSVEFLVPVILVTFFNFRIYRSLWKRGNLSRCLSHPRPPSVSSSDHGSSCKEELCSRPSLPAPEGAAASLRSELPRRKSSLVLSLRAQMNSSVIASKMSSDSISFHQREQLELLRARKLAKSLAILLGVFAICWAPYSLFTIVRSVFSKQGTKSIWFETAFWLQWFNSFVNPFLYPLCHKRFQKAFLKIFWRCFVGREGSTRRGPAPDLSGLALRPGRQLLSWLAGQAVPGEGLAVMVPKRMRGAFPASPQLTVSALGTERRKPADDLPQSGGFPAEGCGGPGQRAGARGRKRTALGQHQQAAELVALGKPPLQEEPGKRGQRLESAKHKINP